MTLDVDRCIDCGACDDVAPGMLARPERIAIAHGTLEAMAACPVGALHWLEGESRMEPKDMEANTVTTLDMRTIAPRDRHPLIFRTFDALAPGGDFELINDHDPKPLYYQFQAERTGLVEWEYLEQGPERWRVRIGRAA